MLKTQLKQNARTAIGTCHIYCHKKVINVASAKREKNCVVRSVDKPTLELIPNAIFYLRILVKIHVKVIWNMIEKAENFRHTSMLWDELVC